jgi:alkylation response protein AidB-like acyl-CoA dehydrogenase
LGAVLTPEQQEIRSTAGRFLEEKSTSESVRSLMESEPGFDESTWKQMAELGWLGITIPEEYGGLGLGFEELAILLEEMGKHLLPAPFLSSAVMASRVVLHGGSEEQKAEILPKIADGTTRATVAFTEPSGRWSLEGVTLEAKQVDEGYALEGSKMFVLDGHTANLVVVAARGGENGSIVLLLVDPDDDTVARKALDTLDGTRKQARIDFSGTKARLLGTVESGAQALQRTLDESAVAIAAEAVGTAQACLDMATSYANTRIQFGRPIGSFQGIKHKCADMLIEVENARSAAFYGAWAAAREPDELGIAACVAKAYASDTVFDCGAKNIQIHGGIGFTWEHDAHLYFRRAKTQEIYLGDASYHRALLMDRLGI